MMTLLELEKPVSSAESVEDIRKSIDLENRGSAYMLPSGNISSFLHSPDGVFFTWLEVF